MSVLTEEPRTQTQASGGGSRRPPGTRNALAEEMPSPQPAQPRASSSAAIPFGALLFVGSIAFWLIKWLA